MSTTAVKVAPTPKATKPKVAKKPSSHPKTADMVLEAIAKLNEKGGSSLQAVKKYLKDVHKVDVERNASFIRKALVSLTKKGKLTQKKGKGASGSFKLAEKPKKSTGEKKARKPKSPKKSPKAKTAAKKVSKPKGEKKAKSPKKTGVKKTAKPKTTKVKLPKTLKPKTASKPKSPKKAAPKK